MITPIVSEKEEKVNSFVDFHKVKLFRKRYKINIKDQILLYEQLLENSEISTPQLLTNMRGISITIGQFNRIRKEWGLSKKQGRPCKNKENEEQKEKSELQEVSYLSEIGLSLFAAWLIQENKYDPVLAAICMQIEHYKQQHPEGNFRLLGSRKETVIKKWQAITLLPLLGIKKISELDYTQHNMVSVLGHNYGSSSLTQFLGELERVDAHIPLNEVLSSGKDGNICYIDGHLIPFWSRRKMHKGHVTMLGRIMPGSNAVVAHNELGEAIWAEYYPPDIHLVNIVQGYCARIEETTGIHQFVIDREVNAVEIARKFISNGWDLICLLDSNQYKGLESFKKKFSKQLDDGTVLYKANWSEYKEDDPRRFVIASTQDHCIVYWGTPDIVKQLTAEEFINTYRGRSDIQENSFKHMIAHGALNTNFGIKTIIQPDRTQQRKISKVEQKIEKLQLRKQKVEQKISLQSHKINDSQEKKHTKLLEKRVGKLQNYQAHSQEIQKKIDAVENQKQKIGTLSQRADRDFRKQTIMTFRTLWLENLLRVFISFITGSIKSVVDIEVVLKLFFSRPGFMVETESKITYWLESENLSLKYKNILQEIADDFNKISLTLRGKEIFLEIEGFA